MDKLEQKYFNTKSAAHYLGLSAATLQKYRSFGKGPLFQKIGSKITYQLCDLDAWAQKRRYQATSEYKGELL